MILDQAIKGIKDLESLLDFLRDKLDWPLEEQDLETLTYEYYADELGLDAQYENMISSIRQLRPLVDSQPWGIFFLDFKNKSLPVGALRKILSGLVFSKRRNNEHAVWEKSELLFVCSLKYEDNLVIGFVHFKDSDSSVPSINTFYWDVNREQNYNFKSKLEMLTWPEDINKIDEWKQSWSSAFTTIYREPIRQSRQLVERLAELAQNTRDRVKETYSVENTKGDLHKLYGNFQALLIHDLSADDFADMYAQTVAYGLFSARCMDTDGHFELSEVVERIPNTNPFLKQLLSNCFEHGMGNSTSLMFDELAIGEIVDMLDHTDTEELLNDFGRQTGGGIEDPVIHFYEGFLDAYEHEQKKRRGVYYTPDPVVSFIVRSVDEILREDFGYTDGLADISTKSIEYQRESKKQTKGTQTKYVTDTKEVPAIQILDPATGTGTFLAHTILQIKANFDHKHQGKSAEEIKELWNEYVPEHLLPRLNGFEIMMAPYSVAHMKLGLVLRETGYDFQDQERLNVYLTNTLEEAGSQEITLFDLLSDESAGANRIKNNNGINVVIGNPPYLGESTNKSQFIYNLMRGQLPDGSKTENYFELNGESLGERNSKWLNDDYVKFIRYGQQIIDQSAEGGILAFITNHGYLDNPTFRGMRESLFTSFNKIYILNLHGNSKRKEKCPDGAKDENVFDILPGVSIGIFIKHPNVKDHAIVKYCNIWGARGKKYQLLMQNNIKNIEWSELQPKAPNFLFIPQDLSCEKEYFKYMKITSIIPMNSVGIATARDSFTIQWSEEDIWNTIIEFSSSPIEEARTKFSLGKDVQDWKVSWALDDIIKSGPNKDNIRAILYRVFDERYTYYTGKSRGFLCRPRLEVMSQMQTQNLGLCVTRGVEIGRQWEHVFCTRLMIDHHAVSMKEVNYLLPLYIYSQDKNEGVANLNPDFIAEINRHSGLSFVGNKGDLISTFGPEDVFDYIYAILNAGSYRSRYAEFLKVDFPYIPVRCNKQLFVSLCNIGQSMVALHLLESLVTPITTFVGSGNNNVEKITYISNNALPLTGKIQINSCQAFDNVPQTIWEFHIGGYQVCHKWLKDRKGRILSEADINHYQQIVAILSETISLMDKIDEVIEEHGGWPLT